MRQPLLVVAAAAALSSCGAFVKGEPPVCPDVVILADAARLTQFAGAGRTPADIEVEAEIVGYKGECRRVKNGVELTLAVLMDARRGKADTDGVVDVSYFVAMPDHYPDPRAKAVFGTRIAFPDNAATVAFDDAPVTVTVPVAPGETAAGKEIYLGFQLSDEQLRYNRDKGRP